MAVNKAANKIVLFFLVFCCTCIQLQANPARVIILRHAEKTSDPDDINLSPKGYERANALVKLFDIHPEYAIRGFPSQIFAAKYIPGKNSKRSVETVTPLAEKLGLPVQSPFNGSSADKMADQILKNRDYDGKVIMIAWSHGNIPNLATALGADSPQEWDGPEVFDRLWVLDFSENGVTFTDLPESVLPDDSE